MQYFIRIKVPEKTPVLVELIGRKTGDISQINYGVAYRHSDVAPMNDAAAARAVLFMIRNAKATDELPMLKKAYEFKKLVLQHEPWLTQDKKEPVLKPILQERGREHEYHDGEIAILALNEGGQITTLEKYDLSLQGA